MAKRVIQIEPDAPALIAQRIMARLLQGDLLPPTMHAPRARPRLDAITEAIADEIHLHAVEGTLRGGSPAAEHPRGLPVALEAGPDGATRVVRARDQWIRSALEAIGAEDASQLTSSERLYRLEGLVGAMAEDLCEALMKLNEVTRG